MSVSDPSMPLLSRRNTLALMPMAAAGMALPWTGEAGAVAAATMKRAGFDPASPEDNFRLWIKLHYSLIKEPIHSYFGGLAFALEGDLPPRLLFEVDGYGQGWVDPQPDGSYRLAWKEIGLLKDPETGRILDTWRNPIINEDVKVRHILNPAANATLRARDEKMDASFLTAEVEQTPRNYKNPRDPHAFILPWQTIGKYTSVWNDARLAMKHTLDPKIWVRESSGERISIGEFFQLVAKTEELFDPKLNKVDNTGAWARVASWHPWMLMGQRPGKMFYRCSVQRLSGPEELPPAFHAALQERYPDALVQPTQWGPRFSTWKDFLAKNKPMPPKP